MQRKEVDVRKGKFRASYRREHNRGTTHQPYGTILSINNERLLFRIDIVCVIKPYIYPCSRGISFLTSWSGCLFIQVVRAGCIVIAHLGGAAKNPVKKCNDDTSSPHALDKYTTRPRVKKQNPRKHGELYGYVILTTSMQKIRPPDAPERNGRPNWPALYSCHAAMTACCQDRWAGE